MARITVEDCIGAIPNRFELVLLAAERARALGRGVASDLTPDRDKRPVIALREIAAGTVSPENLREDYIAKFRGTDETDRPDDLSDAFGPDMPVVPDRDTAQPIAESEEESEPEMAAPEAAVAADKPYDEEEWDDFSVAGQEDVDDFERRVSE